MNLTTINEHRTCLVANFNTQKIYFIYYFYTTIPIFFLRFYLEKYLALKHNMWFGILKINFYYFTQRLNIVNIFNF